jgi:hypothetical protein
LLRVQPKANKSVAPQPAHPLDADFGDVKLLGYEVSLDSTETTEDGTAPRDSIRATLYWQPRKKLENSRLVSLKLLDANGRLAGQLDRRPVLDAYPTNLWRSGEYIADTHEVPIFVGAAPGEYALQVTMYDPESGHVYGQTNLDTYHLAAQQQDVPREQLGMQQAVQQNLGGIELSGYDLDTSEPYPQGSSIPLTLLWRVLDGNVREYEIALLDELGQVRVTRAGQVSGKTNQFVRQDIGIEIPTSTPPGKYQMRVNTRGSLPLTGGAVELGALEVSPP